MVALVVIVFDCVVVLCFVFVQLNFGGFSGPGLLALLVLFTGSLRRPCWAGEIFERCAWLGEAFGLVRLLGVHMSVWLVGGSGVRFWLCRVVVWGLLWLWVLGFGWVESGVVGFIVDCWVDRVGLG